MATQSTNFAIGGNIFYPNAQIKSLFNISGNNALNLPEVQNYIKYGIFNNSFEQCQGCPKTIKNNTPPINK